MAVLNSHNERDEENGQPYYYINILNQDWKGKTSLQLLAEKGNKVKVQFIYHYYFTGVFGGNKLYYACFNWHIKD